eukprot:s2488_g2.t1
MVLGCLRELAAGLNSTCACCWTSRRTARPRCSAVRAHGGNARAQWSEGKRSRPALAPLLPLSEAAAAGLQQGDSIFVFLDDTYVVSAPERTGVLRGALEAALRSHARIRLHDSKTLIWNAAGEEPHGIAALQPAGADPVSTSSSSLYPADQQGLLVLGTPLGSDAYVQRVLRDRRGVQDSALHVACSRRSPIRAVSPVFLCVSASKLPSPHAPTGSGVARNVRLADVNIDVPVSADRRIEVVTNELSLGHGARQAVDAYHTRALDPHPAAHVHPGRAADGTARRKRRQTYPELECARLVVVGLKSAAAGACEAFACHCEELGGLGNLADAMQAVEGYHARRCMHACTATCAGDACVLTPTSR